MGAATLGAAANLTKAEVEPQTLPREDTEQIGDWTFTGVDDAIAEEVREFLPPKLFDIHAHLYRNRDLGDPCPALTAPGPEAIDWNVYRAHLGKLTTEKRLVGGLYFPYPTKTGDVDAGNEYVVEQVTHGDLVRGLVVVTPKSSPEKMNEYLKHPRILGFKPYHTYAGVPQTFDAALVDYVPEWIWQLADEHGAIIMLHIVRTGALSDPGNQEAILRLCGRYTNVKLVLAHAGRGFHAPNTINALPRLLDLENVYFDSAAVCEPDALMAILKTFGPGRLLWGSDFPVSQQRGKCVTVGDAFSWICPRRIDVDPSAPICHPTLVGLESLRALKLAAHLMDLKPQDLEEIFHRNAMRVLGIREA